MRLAMRGAPCRVACRAVALLGLLAFVGCESDACCFQEGEHLRIEVQERVQASRGRCVPLEVGDSFTVEIGEIDAPCWDHEPDEVACKRAPLRGIPAFARGSLQECGPHPNAMPFELRCTGDLAAACTPAMELALSPILRRGVRRVERGHLVVRWQASDGAREDAGVSTPCPEVCEESFRVRIELRDR